MLPAGPQLRYGPLWGFQQHLALASDDIIVILKKKNPKPQTLRGRQCVQMQRCRG